MVRLVCTHYSVQITQQHCSYTSAGCSCHAPNTLCYSVATTGCKTLPQTACSFYTKNSLVVLVFMLVSGPHPDQQ